MSSEAARQKLKDHLMQMRPEVRALAVTKLRQYRSTLASPPGKSENESAIRAAPDDAEGRIQRAAVELEAFGVTVDDVRDLVHQKSPAVSMSAPGS